MNQRLITLPTLLFCLYFIHVWADEAPQAQLLRQMESLMSELQQLQTANALMSGGMPATPKDRIKQITDSVNRATMGSGLNTAQQWGQVSIPDTISLSNISRRNLTLTN